MLPALKRLILYCPGEHSLRREFSFTELKERERKNCVNGTSFGQVVFGWVVSLSANRDPAGEKKILRGTRSGKQLLAVVPHSLH